MIALSFAGLDAINIPLRLLSSNGLLELLYTRHPYAGILAPPYTCMQAPRHLCPPNASRGGSL